MSWADFLRRMLAPANIAGIAGAVSAGVVAYQTRDAAAIGAAVAGAVSVLLPEQGRQ